MSKIVLEDFNEGGGFYKVNLAYLNKEQVEEIEAIVSKWNLTDEDMKDCIGMCLTDVDEQRFRDYNTNLRDCLDWLEKQSESDETKVKMFLINKGYPIDTNGIFPTYEEMYNIIKEGLEKQGETYTKKDVDDAYLKGVCDTKQELEKQGEQKHVDKVEPKFKIGDFIVNDYCIGRIVEITNDAYLLDTEQGIPFSSHSTRLWDITKDAKDGDVLINWNNTAFIFKSIEDETVKFHIAYNEKWDAIKTPSTKLSHLGLPEPQFEFHPATKEQRDTLFAKMKEAGYEWNAELKKVHKITTPADVGLAELGEAWEEEANKQSLANSAKTCKKSQRMVSAEAKEALYDKPATIDIDKMVYDYANNRERGNEEFGKPLNCMIRAYRQGLKDAIGKVVSESDWSEEDEEMLDGIILRCEKYGHQEQIDWLKSIKQRIKGE